MGGTPMTMVAPPSWIKKDLYGKHVTGMPQIHSIHGSFVVGKALGFRDAAVFGKHHGYSRSSTSKLLGFWDKKRTVFLGFYAAGLKILLEFRKLKRIPFFMFWNGNWKFPLPLQLNIKFRIPSGNQTSQLKIPPEGNLLDLELFFFPIFIWAVATKSLPYNHQPTGVSVTLLRYQSHSSLETPNFSPQNHAWLDNLPRAKHCWEDWKFYHLSCKGLLSSSML